MADEYCPKCRIGDVYATNVFDNTLHLPKADTEIFSMRAIVKERVAIRRLVCVACGYLETYIVDHEFLKRVPQSSAWVKV